MRTLLGRLTAHPRLSACIAVVILAAAAAGGYFASRNDSAGAAATSSTTTQTVGVGTIKQSVSATGSLAPAAEENLNFTVSGQVTRVAVSEGQRVKKGQVLATVDSASLSAQVAQAKASVASDQARVDDDSESDSTQQAADEAALTASKNQLASAQKQLSAASLTSPIGGVVATVDLAVGQSVSGSNSSSTGSSTNSGPQASGSNQSDTSTSSSPQILVISTSSWIVNASVDATSVGLIKKGDQAELTVTGASDTVYGTIQSVGLVSSSTSGTASYPVVVEVTGSPSGLHDGASVTATLIYKQLSNVVVVPATALHRNSGGGQYVEKLDGDKTVQAEVQVGVSSGGQTQIVSGLKTGDKIVIPQVRLPESRGGTRPGQTGRTGEFPGRGQFPGGGEFPGGGGGFPGRGQGGGGFGG